MKNTKIQERNYIILLPFYYDSDSEKHSVAFFEERMVSLEQGLEERENPLKKPQYFLTILKLDKSFSL